MEKFSAFGVSDNPHHIQTLIHLREDSRIQEQAYTCVQIEARTRFEEGSKESFAKAFPHTGTPLW